MDDEAISADVMAIYYKRNILAADDASDEENDDTGATTIVTGDKKAGFMGGFLHISGAAVEAGALVDAKLWKKVRKAKGRKVLREIWMTGCILDTMRLSQLCAQVKRARGCNFFGHSMFVLSPTLNQPISLHRIDYYHYCLLGGVGC